MVGVSETPLWMTQDWTVQVDGYRLIIKDGAMAGLAYDEFPWPWGRRPLRRSHRR